MNLRKAIKILEEQKQKIVSGQEVNSETWRTTTASYIKDFFGFNSTEYFRIAQFKWQILASDQMDNDDAKIAYEKKINSIIEFLDNCKEILKNKGLYREPKANFLSEQGNVAIIGIICTISTVIFGIGYYFGTEKINKDAIFFEQQYIRLKDSTKIKNIQKTNSTKKKTEAKL